MSKILVRIESVFDISIGKLLADNLDVGFVSPNSRFTELMKINPVEKPHHVNISDLDHRKGIMIKGESEYVEEVENVIREKLPETILFTHDVQQDAIYIATVSKYIYKKKLAIVDIDSKNQAIVFGIETHVGDKLIIQIKELTNEADKLPVGSTQISLPGNYIILEPGSSFVRVSKKIHGDQRKDIFNLGKKILPEGFGIILRTSANNVGEEVIVEEINKLIALWNNVQEEFENNEEELSNRMVSGERSTDLIIDYNSKRILDQIRQEVEPTIVDYHTFRAYSLASGFTLDFVSQFLDRFKLEEVESQLRSMITNRDFPVLNHLRVEFLYLDGTTEETIIGDITQNDPVIVTKQVLENDIHEIPGFSAMVGDIMEVHMKPGSWTIHYRFISSETGKLLGQWLRIITPLEITYRGKVRAFDMGMHLFKNGEPDGNITHHVDEKTRLNMKDNETITEALDDKLAKVLQLSTEAIKNNQEQINIVL